MSSDKFRFVECLAMIWTVNRCVNTFDVWTFNIFTKMLLKSKCITVLAFLTLECYVLTLSSDRLNIERGDRDVYDNPDCDSRTKTGCKCKDLNAECVNGTNCTRCRCKKTYATFLSSDSENGECVKNRHLLFISGKSLGMQSSKFHCCLALSLTNIHAWARNKTVWGFIASHKNAMSKDGVSRLLLYFFRYRN